MWAHPRSRGENFWGGHHSGASAGSSPLTRGKRLRLSGHMAFDGLIPAHAGKTVPRLTRATLPWAHPRSRGENVIGTFVAGFQAGSSPLTRGKPQTRDARVESGRAHPRSRGENLIGGCLIAPGQGSSPLTRGKQLYDLGARFDDGLIPAHAGKTRSPIRRSPRYRAHPRSRGENQIQVLKAHLGDGSSPLTRGKRHNLVEALTVQGLIPAHAGKTAGRQDRAPARAAHPRSRGENPETPHVNTPRNGSSPLTRGKPAAATP